MISSQCATNYPLGNKSAATLSDIRKKLKKEIEAEKFLGEKAISVWINENATQHADQTWWDECIDQAKKCDIMLVINSGSAGNQLNGQGIGICHAEFVAALEKSPKKIYVLTLTNNKGKVVTSNHWDEDFQKLLVDTKILEARDFKTEGELIDRAKTEVSRMMRQLALEGAFSIKESGPNTGQALDWSRMNYTERSDAMIEQVNNFLIKRNGGSEEEEGIKATLASKSIYFRPSAIPASFGVSAAREMVGQPFLNDHLHADVLKGRVGGPVHIIACHKNVTETQALSLLGFTDATVITGTFGVYIADKIQKIQLCLLSNCRDPASTLHGLQRFFEWLDRTDEDKQLVNRALSRAKILKVIANEKEE